MSKDRYSGTIASEIKAWVKKASTEFDDTAKDDSMLLHAFVDGILSSAKARDINTLHNSDALRTVTIGEALAGVLRERHQALERLVDSHDLWVNELSVYRGFFKSIQSHENYYYLFGKKIRSSEFSFGAFNDLVLQSHLNHYWKRLLLIHDKSQVVALDRSVGGEGEYLRLLRKTAEKTVQMLNDDEHAGRDNRPNYSDHSVKDIGFVDISHEPVLSDINNLYLEEFLQVLLLINSRTELRLFFTEIVGIPYDHPFRKVIEHLLFGRSKFAILDKIRYWYAKRGTLSQENFDKLQKAKRETSQPGYATMSEAIAAMANSREDDDAGDWFVADEDTADATHFE